MNVLAPLVLIVLFITAGGDQNYPNNEKTNNKESSSRSHKDSEDNSGEKPTSRSAKDTQEESRPRRNAREDFDQRSSRRSSCGARQMSVCRDYDCPVLTCENFNRRVDKWKTCIFKSGQKTTCDRPSDRKRCVCKSGFVLNPLTNKCLVYTDCPNANKDSDYDDDNDDDNDYDFNWLNWWMG